MRRRKYLFKRLINVISPLQLCDYNLKNDRIQNREKIPPSPQVSKNKKQNKKQQISLTTGNISNNHVTIQKVHNAQCIQVGR